MALVLKTCFLGYGNRVSTKACKMNIFGFTTMGGLWDSLVTTEEPFLFGIAEGVEIVQDPIRVTPIVIRMAWV